MGAEFPPQQPGVRYLTEGGTETEIMYRYGYDFPEFAVFMLLDNPSAKQQLLRMFQDYLKVAEQHDFIPMMAGLDYRASSDWLRKLGFDDAQFSEVQRRCIDFLHEVAKPFEGSFSQIIYTGGVGPRGDAYQRHTKITAEEAQEYHQQQVETLRQLGVDLIWAATFNNSPEAVGVARACHSASMPLSLSFTLNSENRLGSGESLREAIEKTDLLTGDASPAFYGINCSHPDEFEPALEPGDWFKRVRCVRPNAAKMEKVALCKLNHLEEGDPPDLAKKLRALAQRYPHIDIWGGCCGTWDKHLNLIAAAVK